MGLFWDLLQQSDINQHARRAATIEQRLERSEADIARLSALVHELIVRLEARLGTDLDQDGRIGS